MIKELLNLKQNKEIVKSINVRQEKDVLLIGICENSQAKYASENIP